MSSVSRIVDFIESQRIKKSVFYRKTGMSNGYLDKVKELGADKYASIISNYPEINPDWLLTGKGSMLKDKPSQNTALSEGNTVVPLIPLHAMAGQGIGTSAVMDYDISNGYVVPDFKGVDFMIKVKGSSMMPKYNSGDVVACKKLNLADIFFQWNKVYVLDTEQGALIKRVRKGSDKDHILIVSDNDKYEPFELHLSKIHAIAIVMGVIRLE